MKILWQAFVFLSCMTVLTGVAYPALVGLVGWCFWPEKIRGSLIFRGDEVVGSSLLAQPFHRAGYFWPRPLVVSNLSPTSAQLKRLVDQRRKDLAKRMRLAPDAVPEDLLMGSGSGFDPHISPEAARVQVARVAAARDLGETELSHLKKLLEDSIEWQQFHALGEPRINVLRLNLAVDEKFGTLKR
jgi:K+-transporting ATPase ATPase C chain